MAARASESGFTCLPDWSPLGNSMPPRDPNDDDEDDEDEDDESEEDEPADIREPDE